MEIKSKRIYKRIDKIKDDLNVNDIILMQEDGSYTVLKNVRFNDIEKGTIGIIDDFFEAGGFAYYRISDNS